MSDEFWTNEQLNEQIERLVLSFQTIAKSLEGLHDEAKRAGNRYWPQPREQKEAVVSRIENEEDRANKNLGIDNKSVSIDQWLADLGDPEADDIGVVGERSRQWVIDHPPEKVKEPDAGAKSGVGQEESGPSTEAPESESGTPSVSPSPHAPDQIDGKRRSKSGS